MSKQLLKLLPIVLFMIMYACTSDNEEDLFPDSDCDAKNVTYSQTVTSIIQSNCLSCHSQNIQTAGINLEGYNNIKVYAQNGFLYGAISHAPGFTPMPFGGAKLSACDIQKIKAWIDAGALNN
ncbi:MAG: cytochrome c [Saprospiraceae bacterium]|nr:cytochrome c [Saprospiraceae bacterium]